MTEGVPVGVIGLGQMGTALSRSLLATGRAVVGYDVDTRRAQALANDGGRATGSAAEVAQECDVLLTSLPSVAALHAVLDGPGGLLATHRGDSVIVETSTLPLEAKEWARDTAASVGVTVLDCPLSGTAAQAISGDLVVLASGDPDALRRCAPVFDGFARAWFDLGAFGNGSRMKYVANLMVAIHNTAAAEALVLARKAGLDPATTLEVLIAGASTSRMLEVRGPSMVQQNFNGAGMQIKTFAKDVSMISAFARGLGCPVPLFSTAEQLYEAAGVQGLGELDTAAVITVLERLSGIDQGDHPGVPDQ